MSDSFETRVPYLHELTSEEWGVIQTLLRNGSLTRSDIADTINFGLSKTESLLRGLYGRGFLGVRQAEVSTKGRRPFMYSVVPDIAYFVGTELHVVYDRIVIINFAGTVVHSAEYPPSYAATDVVGSVIQNITKTIDESKVDKSRISAIGISLHGIIDYTEGLIHRVLYSGEQIELNVKSPLTEAFSIPVFVTQSRILVLYREKGPEIFKMKGVTVNLYHGYGIGVGLFIDGNYFRSVTGMAGQIGHVPVAGNKKPCYCGNVGCLRTLVSYKGISERALEELEKGYVSSINPKMLEGPRYEDGVNHIIDCALKQDKISVALIHETSELLGDALAQVVNLFNPNRLFIHTNLVRAGEIFTAPLRLYTQRNSLSSSFACLEIEFAELSPFAVAEGGAYLALCEYAGVKGED